MIGLSELVGKNLEIKLEHPKHEMLNTKTKHDHWYTSSIVNYIAAR